MLGTAWRARLSALHCYMVWAGMPSWQHSSLAAAAALDLGVASDLAAWRR